MNNLQKKKDKKDIKKKMRKTTELLKSIAECRVTMTVSYCLAFICCSPPCHNTQVLSNQSHQSTIRMRTCNSFYRFFVLFYVFFNRKKNANFVMSLIHATLQKQALPPKKKDRKEKKKRESKQRGS